jgi:Arc/MetJ family transcription regulator
MSTRKTSVAIDESLLEEARDILRTDSIKDTVNRALLEVVRTQARREEVEAMSVMEGLELNNDEVMEGAWRN